MTGHMQVQPIRTDVPGVSFGRLIGVELRKLVDTRASRAILAVLLGLWVLTLIILILTQPEWVYGTYTALFGTIGYLLAPVVPIMLVTSEWSQRAALQTFTVEPRRERVIGAKLVGVAIFTAVVIALIMLFGAVGAGASGGEFDGFGDALLGQVVAQCFATLMGFGFGVLMLNSPAAIALYYVVPIAVTLVGSFSMTYLEHYAEWVDRFAVVAPFSAGDLSGEAWQHLGVGALIWVIIPMAAGLVRVMSAEVK